MENDHVNINELPVEVDPQASAREALANQRQHDRQKEREAFYERQHQGEVESAMAAERYEAEQAAEDGPEPLWAHPQDVVEDLEREFPDLAKDPRLHKTLEARVANAISSEKNGVTTEGDQVVFNHDLSRQAAQAMRDSRKELEGMPAHDRGLAARQLENQDLREQIVAKHRQTVHEEMISHRHQTYDPGTNEDQVLQFFAERHPTVANDPTLLVRARDMASEMMAGGAPNEWKTYSKAAEEVKRQSDIDEMAKSRAGYGGQYGIE